MKVTEKVRALLFEGKQKKKKKVFFTPDFLACKRKTFSQSLEEEEANKNRKISKKNKKRENDPFAFAFFFFNVCDFSGLQFR